MLDAENELFKLGIPAKTRHNEVAPGQFELAPMFERSNIATDHQQLLMVILEEDRAEARHGMSLPREAVRGNQRFREARELLARQRERGKPPPARRHTARERAVPRLLRSRDPFGPQVRRVAARRRLRRPRTTTVSERTKRRPAIISIFLGDQLTDVFDQIAKGGAKNSKAKGTLEIGVDTLPVLPTDPGDRNRTSPFAFTGNRFEFRVPGSLQSIAGPMVTINTILAEALDYCATEIESNVAAGDDFNAAVQKLLEDVITTHGVVVFNGDGYSDEWQIEAAARGLLNLRTTLDALPQLITPEAMELFSHYGVFSAQRDAQSLRRRARAVRAEHRGRGAAHARDGEHRDPAVGAALPDRIGDEHRRA